MMFEKNEQSAQPKPTRSKAETVLTQYYRVFFVAAAIGLGAILLFPLQAASLAQYFSVFTTGLLFAAAFLAVGSLAGFLFGIPYANKEDGSQPEEPAAVRMSETIPNPAVGVFKPYRPNTNLEQISDWLTKILVGVGLVQLAQLPGALQAFNLYVAPALGGWKSSGFFGVAILIYFLVLGFLLLFLWTRVNLPLLYAQSDVDQNQAYEDGRKEGILLGEKRAVDALGRKIISKSNEGAVRDLAPRESASQKRLLWVDEQPLNNQNEMRILKDTTAVQVDTSITTRDALEKLGSTRYDLVISAIEHAEGFQDGLNMLTQLRATESEKGSEHMPFIFYCGRPVSADVESQVARLGAVRTKSPLMLIEKATDILRG